MTVPARDHAWAERLAAGDEQALREAYREFAPAVFGLAMRVVANEPIAEEVVQDVFVRLWERPESFDPTRGPLRAYLLAMTHSRAVERVRSEDSLRRRHEFAQREAHMEAPVENPEHVLVDKDVSAAIRTALAALPQSQRVPIEMAYFEGHVLPAGCGCTGRAGRHREVPHPLRDAEATDGAAGSRGRAMTYPYDDDETEDRVIARALDTDNSDEAAMDRATLDEYRKVLAYLPFEEIEPPAALEDRTIEAALARRPAEIPSINRRAKRRATARWVTLGAAVTAAAAVIGFMFVTGNDAKATPGGRVDLAGAGTENVVDPVLATPGVRKAPLIGRRSDRRPGRAHA